MGRKSEPMRWAENHWIKGKPNFANWARTEDYIDNRKNLGVKFYTPAEGRDDEPEWARKIPTKVG